MTEQYIRAMLIYRSPLGTPRVLTIYPMTIYSVRTKVRTVFHLATSVEKFPIWLNRPPENENGYDGHYKSSSTAIRAPSRHAGKSHVVYLVNNLFCYDIDKGSKKEQVRQCLGFCTSDIWSWLVHESAVQKPKHCLTFSFLHPLNIDQNSWQWPAQHGDVPSPRISSLTINNDGKVFLFGGVGGHTYMTSAVGGKGGPQKARRKERGCVNYVLDKGGGGQKSKNFADLIYISIAPRTYSGGPLFSGIRGSSRLL